MSHENGFGEKDFGGEAEFEVALSNETIGWSILTVSRTAATLDCTGKFAREIAGVGNSATGRD